MRLAMAILSSGLAASCLTSCGIESIRDTPFQQEFAERWQEAQAPPGAPLEFGLPDDAWLKKDEWAIAARGLRRGARRWGERYYGGKRWLPDDRVTGLAPDGAGGVWARTETGLAHIGFRTMTLEEKAALFEERVRARHLRHGLVASCRLRRPGDLASSETRTDDNDGLWTAIYVAAECFRWAVTRDEEARRNARESYRAIERLQTISGIPGLPARSFVRKGESTGGGEWHPTPDGEWLWKGDTSSDEVDGHFFVAGVYFDLVADAAEKESIRRNLRALMDSIVDHGYYLVDVDGKPTTWGVWAPEKLNRDPAWWRERGLNALEVLSYLATAEHITGDRKYRACARELVEKHGYAENTILQKVAEPPEEVNHSDDQLAFLAYYNLLHYERDPELLAVYRRSLERSILIEVPEANPLWNLIALSGGVRKAEPLDWGLSGDPLRAADLLDAAVRTLRETPLDMVAWRMENSHRGDLAVAPSQSRFDQPVATLPLHPAERGALKYNADPYVLDGGGDGHEEDDGSFFLLAYWLGRYHGFIN